MRNGGLDQGSAMDRDRDDETLSGFDQRIEHNIVNSPGTMEEPLHTGGKGALIRGGH